MISIDVKTRLGAFTLDAQIETGDDNRTLALFGRSGCGKTSLVNTVAGLLRPDHGRIVIGQDVLLDSQAGIEMPAHERRIGYVFQEGRLFPHLNVHNNLIYGQRRNGEGPISLSQAVELLDLTPLLARKPYALSGGERQRVAIGRALLANPRLLLMDEPLASLDSHRKGEILPFIARLRDEVGVPILYVSHAMEEIAQFADQVALMEAGWVVAVDTVERLTARLDLHPLTAFLSARITEKNTADGLMRLTLNGGAKLMVPMADRPLGTEMKLRIRARDVSIALQEPQDISILNRLPGTVIDIRPDTDGPMAEVLIDVGVLVWSRITKLSASTLSLSPGKPVWALIKSVAIDRTAPGRTKPN
jgi:molybdate transport system ATP-binding protein